MKVSTTDLAAFLVKLQEWHSARWLLSETGTLTPPVFEIEPLQKFARIVIQSGGQRGAYGFIDLTNGDLLKTASWKKPAKHARGNIFNDNPLQGCSVYGMEYR